MPTQAFTKTISYDEVEPHGVFSNDIPAENGGGMVSLEDYPVPIKNAVFAEFT